ncbi:MAG TPA: ABC transporter permease subunit [Armatimonadota bacterium]|jgi:ABC-type transport system involved in multi-copper enzyme maturation permease subunit
MSEQANPTQAQIADLSYRGYDGPLQSHALRWWTITRYSLRQATRKKGYVGILLMAALPYLLQAFFLYIGSQVGVGQGGGQASLSFPDRFNSAYSSSLLWLFLMTLMVGAGSIAADNRANALQVYLAKPITKLDYLVGKWMSIAIAVGATSLLPAVALFIFCWGMYAQEGFLRDNSTLFFRMVGACLLPAVLHSSIMLGVSSTNKNPRVAGAAYAGIYFILAAVVQVAGQIVPGDNQELASTVRHLSPGGLLEGLGKHIYQASDNLFPGMRGMSGMFEQAKPELWPMVAAALVLIALGLLVARSRIHAVEVVKG